MRDRVARLRIWLVIGTSLVVLAVAGFLGYAHYRSRAFLAGLPGRLGAEITRQTNDYTYSQTVQGRTIFTLHAAKMEQRKDGVVKLHDVGVVLYGRKQDRADRIYGSEFEYDQARGVVRALGEVHMDLQAPAPAEGAGKKQRAVSVTGGELATGDARVIHVLTSGLVYLTNLGVAATKEDLEFSEGGLTGRAHGADYSSDTGVITLQSAVGVNGLSGGRPMEMTAARAELNQMAQTVDLAGAKVVTQGETIEAANAVVHVRKDGSPERIEGSGRVAISRAGRGVVTASQGEAQMSAAGKAEGLRLWGWVRYAADEDGKRTQAAAADARVRFDGAGEVVGVTATGGASLEERGGAASRVLTARVVEAAFAAGAVKGKREVRDAEAMDGARLVVVNGVGARTEMAGDDLKARFVGGRQITHVVGTGHTVLHQVSVAGVDETSGGDTTELTFQAATGRGAEEELVSAAQAGHVSMVRKTPPRQGEGQLAREEKAAAAKAFYEGEADRMTLTGAVMLMNAESTLWAEKVVAERGSGDATAEGTVRMTYVSAGEGGGKEREPVHVLASRAELRGEGARRAFFYGAGGRMARMWQGTSQVEAPVIQLEEGTRKMTANGPGETMQVHTTLVGSAEDARKGSKPNVVRIVSREMVYTDGVREAVFSGGVVVDDADGRMKAQKATVYLQAGKAAAEKRGAGEMFSGGSVDRVVTVGGVQIDQPGRRGTGEQMVYTASDGMFVLTGTSAVPPRVVDEARGTVTGGALRFHAGDDSVVVTSEGIQSANGVGKRRTETKVKQ